MTKSEGLTLVEAWQASGLSVDEFARERGLKAERVIYWKKRLEKGAAPTAKFLVMAPPKKRPTPDEVQTDETVEVMLDDRGQIRFIVGLGSLGKAVNALREVER